MKIVICGGGQVGAAICESLWQVANIVLIDQDDTVVEDLYSTYDIQGIVGSGTSLRAMHETGMDTADLFIAVTSSDETNIISAMMAEKFGVPHVFCRVRNPEYLEDVKFMQSAIGISEMINPEMDAAKLIDQIITYPTANSIESFAKGNIQLVGLTVKEKSVIQGQTLNEFNSSFKHAMLVCMVKRDNQIIIPDGSFRIQSGDEIHVTAARKDLKDLYNTLKFNKKTVSSVLIIGGGQLTYFLLEQLSKRKKAIKVIENDLENCQRLALAFPKVEVIHADNTDQKVLDAEGIDRYDAVVSINQNDEENMIVSLYAKSRQVPKVITKIDRPYLLKPLSYLGLDTIITPKQLVADRIIRLTRSLKATQNSSVVNLYKLVDEDQHVEAMEFEVLQEAEITRARLMDLDLLDNTLIMGIYRQGKIIIPSGLDQIQVGDHVTIITEHQNISDINQLIKK